MSKNTTKRMLQQYQKAEVDEKLLDFVCAKAHDILYISPVQFCERTGLDNAQAKAFFQAFDVDSFVAFKYILRKCLYYEVTEHGVKHRSPAALADEVIRMEMLNLANYAASFDSERLERLAQDINAAAEINLLCSSTTRTFADYLSHILGLFKVKRHIYDNAKGIDEAALSPDSLVIVWGRRRYSMKRLMQIKRLHEQGFRIVCITDAEDSPFIPVSDYYFVVNFLAFDFNDSVVSGMTMIHILALYLATLREDTLFSTLHERDIITQEDNMFW